MRTTIKKGEVCRFVRVNANVEYETLILTLEDPEFDQYRGSFRVCALVLYSEENTPYLRAGTICWPSVATLERYF